MTGFGERGAVPMTAERRCPYCGASVVLGKLPIVTTNVDRTTGEDGSTIRTPRRDTTVVGRHGSWPVVANPPIVDDEQFWRRVSQRALRADLPPLRELADPADLPARLCVKCATPLPEDIDDRRIFIVAVVGTTGAGKSHYLASMLEQAVKRQGLRAIGCQEFAFDEQSAPVFTRKYFVPVFKRRKQLDHTQGDPEVAHKPLVCRVTFEGAAPALVMFHDLAGEVLVDRTKRAAETSFLRRVDALIVLVDPLSLDRPDGRAWDTTLLAYADQAELINACLYEMPAAQRAETPLAVVVSKSDLLADELTAMYGPDFTDDSPAGDPRRWNNSLERMNVAVRGLLARCGGVDVIAATGKVSDEKVSFHAVAALGGEPDPDTGHISRLHPHRCLDPLVTVLIRLPGLTSRG